MHKTLCCLLGTQLVNGSPVNRSLHEHIGLWANTLQFALRAHCPMHGSTHLRLTHALSIGHSLLIVHSGRQLGGVPTKST